MKLFVLKCRETIKAITSQCLTEKKSNKEVVGELTYLRAFRQGQGKQWKDVTRDTPYLIQNNLTFL